MLLKMSHDLFMERKQTMSKFWYFLYDTLSKGRMHSKFIFVKKLLGFQKQKQEDHQGLSKEFWSVFEYSITLQIKSDCTAQQEWNGLMPTKVRERASAVMAWRAWGIAT